MGEDARRMVVRGEVQGVGFRWHVERAAQAVGALGWARNRPDGSVEVHVQGPAGALEAVERACREGPPSARVDAVDVERAEFQDVQGFSTG